MKKFYLSFVSVLGALGLNAQLTQSNHAPAIGDSYVMLRCDSVTTNPGAAGSGVLWNFSTITTFSNLARTYSAGINGSSSYPQANVVLASAPSDAMYLESTANKLNFYGSAIAVSIVSGTLIYTSPAILASYPMSYNSASTATIAGNVNISQPISTSGTFNGNSSVMVDGSGTITLPGSVTYTDVLRVVTSQTINITTPFASGTVLQKNYDFYAGGIKAPILSFNTTTATVGSTSTSTVVMRNKNVSQPSTVSVPENSMESAFFSSFPNPSNSVVTFATNHHEAKYVSVYDITGRLIEKMNLTDGRSKLDVSSYNNGIYLYTISSENKALKSAKFTVNH